jgi:osmoprotectant transport system ATP-binding protein
MSANGMPGARQALLELIGVSKRHGETTALEPTDLSVARGEAIALIGTSGSGKSTILRLMIGLIRPSSGRVMFDGVELAETALAAARHRMGYVIQDGGLFPHLTARDNALLLGRHLRRPERELGERLDRLSDLARFPRAALSRYPLELSGGQRQRVGLMRALMLEPEVLLLDEPLASLDPIVRASLQDDLARIFSEVGAAVVLVTHDVTEAARLARRIVLLDSGRIVQQGAMADLEHRPATPFVSEFLRAQRRGAAG